MEFDTAVQVKQQLTSLLGIDAGRIRSDRPRIALGYAPKRDSSEFEIALRATSEKDLDRALDKGIDAKVRALTASEIDIRITGPKRVELPTDAVQPGPLCIGASVGHYLTTAGTLGFFAQRIADGVIGIVSNNHVLARCDQGREGDDILQPAPYDGGVRPLDVVGSLAGTFPRLNVADPVVDCAFARLRDGIAYDPVSIAESLTLKPVVGPIGNTRVVMKKGRTTGLTTGRISALGLDNVDVEYPFGTVFLNRQIEIASADGNVFSKPGDSGSLIVDSVGNPIGLLAVGSFDCRLSYANPIGDVLSTLGVTFLI
jgi:hypothetical protein